MTAQSIDLPTTLDPALITQTVAAALKEDIGSGDLTSGLIGRNTTSKAIVKARELCVLCGIPWFSEVFRQLDNTGTIEWHYADGDTIPANSIVCSLQGSARALLTGERTALNFLQLLSSTATITQLYANAVKNSDTQILDTRKTIPGLRSPQKYAVICGGGKNHRQGLFDAILIKENHIAASGSINAAVAVGRQLNPTVMLEVEVESLDELRDALSSGVDRVLLDNFSLEKIKAAVSEKNVRAPYIELEASGGIDLNEIHEIAKTGVNYISIGALTKNIKAIDFSMRLL
jgi:nicotinate-nucleotide pyrophosphorylase (carboxylating)